MYAGNPAAADNPYAFRFSDLHVKTRNGDYSLQQNLKYTSANGLRFAFYEEEVPSARPQTPISRKPQQNQDYTLLFFSAIAGGAVFIVIVIRILIRRFRSPHNGKRFTERDSFPSPDSTTANATPPKVFVSYAWGDISPIASEEDRQRQEVVDRLCRRLEKENWQVVRDKKELDYGDSISDFMKTLGQSNLVIVVLSAKYLHSPYCVTELYDVYRRSLGEKEDFLRRIIPLVLKDAPIGAWRDRVAYAEYWEMEFKAMEQHFTHLGEEDLRLYKAMKRWHNEVGDVLTYVNDVLGPHGFDEIVKDDFAALRQMLSRHR